MINVNRLVLDVLKPHHPNALEFARAIAETSPDCRVQVTVLEVDEKTETLRVEVTGRALDFDLVHAAIGQCGGSLHSIDEVDVSSISPGEQ